MRLLRYTAKTLTSLPPRVALVLLFICLALTGAIEYKENSVEVPVHDWMDSEIQALPSNHTGGFSFAVLGDNKGKHNTFNHIMKRLETDPDIVFTIHLGDMVQHRSPLAFTEFYTAVRSRYHKPFFAIPGNHDVKWWSSELYSTIFGPRYYSFRFGDTAFICLDASGNSALNAQQLQWFEDTLSESQDASHLIVLMHQPLHDPRGGTYDHALLSRNARKLNELFKKYSVSYVFAGHVHEFYQGDWDGVPFIVSGSAGVSMNPTEDEHEFAHYVKVRVDADGVYPEVVRMENKPGVTSPKEDPASEPSNEPFWSQSSHLEKAELLLFCCIVLLVLSLLCSVVFRGRLTRSNRGVAVKAEDG